MQLKSTLVDRIIRDLGLIPPDHDVIKESQTLGLKLTSKLGLRKIFLAKIENVSK